MHKSVNELSRDNHKYYGSFSSKEMALRPSQRMSTARKLAIGALVIGGLALLIGLGVLGYGKAIDFTKSLVMTDIASFAVALIAGVGGVMFWLRSRNARRLSDPGHDKNVEPLFFFENPESPLYKYYNKNSDKSFRKSACLDQEQKDHKLAILLANQDQKADLNADTNHQTLSSNSTYMDNKQEQVDSDYPFALHLSTENNQPDNYDSNLQTALSMSVSQPTSEQQKLKLVLQQQDKSALTLLRSGNPTRANRHFMPKDDGDCLFNAVAYAAEIGVDPWDLREEIAEVLAMIMTGETSDLKQYLTNEIEKYLDSLRSSSERPKGCPNSYYESVCSSTSSPDDWLGYCRVLYDSDSTPLFGGEIELLLLAQLDRFKDTPIICYSGGGGGRNILANVYCKGSPPQEVGSDDAAIDAFKGSSLAILLSNASMHYGAFVL